MGWLQPFKKCSVINLQLKYAVVIKLLSAISKVIFHYIWHLVICRVTQKVPKVWILLTVYAVRFFVSFVLIPTFGLATTAIGTNTWETISTNWPHNRPMIGLGLPHILFCLTCILWAPSVHVSRRENFF